MLNIEKYKDEIIEEYQNLLITTDIDTDGNKMNTAIKIVASEKCNKCLKGAKEPFMWLLEEYTEPILDEVEKRYLAYVIRPFRDKVRCITKCSDGREWIVIEVINDVKINFPYFEKGSMYRGMELERKYTLEELGL